MDNRNSLLVFLAKNMDKSLSLNQISKFSGIPYATLYRLHNENKSLLDKKIIGKTIIISLKKIEIVKNYLIVASYEEMNEFLAKNPLFKKISEDLSGGDYSLVLFGSYAEEKHTKASDIDLLIINKDGSKNINFSKYETLFKIEINPIFVSFIEFEAMLKDKEENVGKQVLKKHIILYNQELFWNWVFKNGI
ncbi:MAG: nucleotidyltransferase domain-containing protein [Nanoarchaeota archaeon]